MMISGSTTTSDLSDVELIPSSCFVSGGEAWGMLYGSDSATMWTKTDDSSN